MDVETRLPDGSSSASTPSTSPGSTEEDVYYFGEGEGFSEELDYTGAEPITIERRGSTLVQRLIPGAVQEFFVTHFDLRRALTSIAAGFVLVLLALHTVRWMRAA